MDDMRMIYPTNSTSLTHFIQSAFYGETSDDAFNMAKAFGMHMTRANNGTSELILNFRVSLCEDLYPSPVSPLVIDSYRQFSKDASVVPVVLFKKCTEFRTFRYDGMLKIDPIISNIRQDALIDPQVGDLTKHLIGLLECTIDALNKAFPDEWKKECLR